MVLNLPEISFWLAFWLILPVVGLTVEELVWVLRARAGEFIQGFRRARKSSEVDSRGMLSTFNTLKRGVQAVFASMAVAAIAKMGQIGVAMADTAARGQRLRDSFHNLARASGESGDRILAALNRGLGGALPNFEMVQEANRALVSGLPATAKEMERLAFVARGMAGIVGTTVPDAFQRLVRGITKQEIELLDDLFGGSVRFQDILRKLPSTASAATRQLAIYNEVLRVGEERIRQAGGIQEKFSDRLARTRARIVNLKEAVGAGLIPVMDQFLKIVNAAVDGLDKLANHDMIDRLRELGAGQAAEQLSARRQQINLRQQRGEARGRLVSAMLSSGMFLREGPEGVSIEEVGNRLNEAIDKEVQAILNLDKAEQALQEGAGVFTGHLQRRVDAAKTEAEEAKKTVEQLRNIKTILEEIEGIERRLQQLRETPIQLPEMTVRSTSEGFKAIDVTPGVRFGPRNIYDPTTYSLTPEQRARIQNLIGRSPASGVLFRTPTKEEATDDVFSIKNIIPPKAIENTEKQFDGATERMREALTEVPKSMEDRAMQAFQRMEAAASALGLRMRGFFGGAFNLQSGLQGLLAKTPATTGNQMLNTLIGISGKLGATGQVIAGTLGIAKGLFGGLKGLFGGGGSAPAPVTPGLTTSEQEQAQRDAAIQAARERVGGFQSDIETTQLKLKGATGSYRIGLLNTLQNTETDRAAAQRELDRLVAGGSVREGGGTRTFSSAATVTEASFAQLLAVQNSMLVELREGHLKQIRHLLESGIRVTGVSNALADDATIRRQSSGL